MSFYQELNCLKLNDAPFFGGSFRLKYSGTVKCIEPEYNKSIPISSIVNELTDEQIVALNIGAFNMTNVMASEVGHAGFTVAGRQDRPVSLPAAREFRV